MITADYNEMQNAAKKISDAARDYNTNVTDLYNIVDNLTSVWEGEDNKAFANQVNGYKNDILALGTIVNNYAIFLSSTASNLATTQSDIRSAAGRL